MSIDLFDNPPVQTNANSLMHKQQTSLNDSVSTEFQHVLTESNPERKKQQMERLLNKNPNLISRMFKGKPNPAIRQGQVQMYQDQIKQWREMGQLAHEIKITLLKEHADSVIRKLAIGNATDLAKFVAFKIEEINKTIELYNSKFIGDFDKRIIEIDRLYESQYAKDLAYRTLHKRVALHEETINTLLETTVKSLQQKIPLSEHDISSVIEK